MLSKRMTSSELARELRVPVLWVRRNGRLVGGWKDEQERWVFNPNSYWIAMALFNRDGRPTWKRTVLQYCHECKKFSPLEHYWTDQPFTGEMDRNLVIPQDHLACELVT